MSLNEELLERVLSHIEADLPHFQMGVWVLELDEESAAADAVDFGRPIHCGTVGCIGGWTERLLGKESSSGLLHDGMRSVAGAALGLTLRQQDALFFSNISLLDERPDLLRRHVSWALADDGVAIYSPAQLMSYPEWRPTSDEDSA